MNKPYVSFVLVFATALVLMHGAGRYIPQGRAAEPNDAKLAKESLALDDMENVSDWYNGSAKETSVSSSGKHVKQGKHS